MRKQRLEELLATYRQLNQAETEELEQGIARSPEYAATLSSFRQLDHALQVAGSQQIRQVQAEQSRMNAMRERVMAAQAQANQAGWVASLGRSATSMRPLAGLALSGVLLILLLFTYTLMGTREGGNREAGVVNTLPPTMTSSTLTGTLTGTLSSPLTLTRSGGPAFAFGIEATLLNGAAEAALGATDELGFTWVRQNIKWADFQPAADGAVGTPTALDAINWAGLQKIVQAAQAREIKLLVTVTDAPDWARAPGFDANFPGPAADPQKYAAFVGVLAGEFCGSALQAIEIWHGQNLHYTWGNLSPDPAAYMEMLQAAYTTVKATCPSMWVISGAPIPAGNNLPMAMDDLDYLEAMYVGGLVNVADGIGAHHDGYNIPALARWENACSATRQSGNLFDGACQSPHHSWSLRSTLESYREIMLRNGGGDKQLWPTSFGWPAREAHREPYSPSYTYVMDNNEEEQATWSVEAYQMMRAAGWVGPAFLNNLNYRAIAPDTPEAQWSILQSDYAPLPAFEALKTLASAPEPITESITESITATTASEALVPVALATPCSDPRTVIHSPVANQLLSGIVTISGTATHDAFQFYKLERAFGANQVGGFVQFGDGNLAVNNGTLALFDTTSLANGEYTLRLLVVDQAGSFVPPCDVTVMIQN